MPRQQPVGTVGSQVGMPLRGVRAFLNALDASERHPYLAWGLH